MLQAETLNAQTGALLTEIRTHTQGTQTMLGDQMKTVLDHAFRQVKGTGEQGEGALPLAAVERTVRRAVDNALASPEAMTGTVTSDAVMPTPMRSETAQDDFGPSEADRAILRRLETYPDSAEGVEHFKRLAALSPIAVAQFRRYVDDELMSRRLGGAPGLAVRKSGSPFSDELLAAGLLETVPTPSGDAREWRALTDAGREVGRLLAGEGVAPDYLRDTRLVNGRSS